MTTTTAAVPLQLVDLPSFAFTVVPFLEGEDILSLRQVSHGVQETLIDDNSEAVWSWFLRQEFDGYEGRQSLRVEERHLGPSVFGTTGSRAIVEFATAFETWKQWKQASWRYNSGADGTIHLKPSYFLRAANVWERLEQWLLQQDSLGSIQSTFHQGMTLEELPWPGPALTMSTLTATRALLAFYGGQRHQTVPWSGLLGGFSVYNFVTCSRFVGGQWVDDAVAVGVCPLGRQFGSHKYVVVNPETGSVECRGTPCVTLACRSTESDAVLDWFEEYVRRLETGYYQVGALFEQTLTHGPADAILHYPHKEHVTRTVTRGVEVVASSVFSPWTVSHGFAFVYSIRIRLLEPHEAGYDITQRGFETCQLKSRHWQLRNETTGRVDHVDGDGVVGMYPLLREGSHRADMGRSAPYVNPGDEKPGTFVYQSCTNDSSTSLGGHMLFIPGSLEDPTGPSFQVHVGPFPLNANPEFIY